MLGKQAANTAFKLKACERMLNLEASDGVAQRRLRSVMSDMGTESSLWTVPNFDDPTQKYFPYILPIADVDHGLHHCMAETESAYERSDWDKYMKQLNALSKLFGRRDSLDRWVKFQIRDNEQIPPDSKRSLEGMFKTACPSLCEHRWLFEFEVLAWLRERRAFFKFVQASKVTTDANNDSLLSKDEGSAIKSLLADEMVAAKFWAFALVEFQIQAWGFSVYDWLHSCPCHTRDEQKELASPCPWVGRRLIEVAAGHLNNFYKRLVNLRLDMSQETTDAINTLSQLDSAAADSLRVSFETAKNKVALRFKQASSYLETFPWSLAKLVWYFVDASVVDTERKAQSKLFAQKLLTEYDDGQHRSAGEFARFLSNDHELGMKMREFAGNSHVDMDPTLLREVVAYSASLLCMQRLEAKHHLVSQRLSVARNSTPATLSANLRRSLNPEIKTRSFRELIGQYLLEFGRLVDVPWNSRSDLAKLVSGYDLNIMFRDLSHEQSIIDSQTVPINNTKTTLEHIAHLKSVLEEGTFYALPVDIGPIGETTYLVIQLITFNPSTKKYMQKVLKWGPDPWHEKVGVVILCKRVVAPLIWDCDDPQSPCPLPSDFSVQATSYCPSELPIETFFKFEFDHIYQFEGVDLRSVFASTTLVELSKSEEQNNEMDPSMLHLCDNGICRVESRL